MEESHLAELLPQDEKYRVQILDALGDEVPPQSSSYLQEKRCERGDNRSKRTRVCVRVCDRVMKGEIEHLSRHECQLWKSKKQHPGREHKERYEIERGAVEIRCFTTALPAAAPVCCKSDGRGKIEGFHQNTANRAKNRGERVVYSTTRLDLWLDWWYVCSIFIP